MPDRDLRITKLCIILIFSFWLKGIAVKKEFQKFSFVYIYKTYYAKSLLHKYYSYPFLGPHIKKKKNTKNIFKRKQKKIVVRIGF